MLAYILAKRQLGNYWEVKKEEGQSNMDSAAGILSMVSIQRSVSKYFASYDVMAWPFIHVPTDN